MAPSGNYHLEITALDVITDALGIVGVHALGSSLDASEADDGLRTLNMMLKGWQQQYGIWLNEEIWMFFENGKIQYDIGPTGDHYAIDAIKTEIATAAVSGASSIVIDSTTGFNDTFDRDGIIKATAPTAAGAITFDGALAAAGIATLSGQRKVLIFAVANESARTFAVVGKDAAGNAVTEDITGPTAGNTVYSTSEFKTITSVATDAATAGNIEVGQVGDHVGIEQDDDTIHWTFFAGSVSTTFSIVTAITDTVAVDNHVYTYTVKTPRPTEVVEVRLAREDGTHVPIYRGGRGGYELLSNKTIPGTPNQAYYDKQLDNAEMLVWPAPNNMKEYLRFTGRVPIQIMSSLTDTFAMAQEWLEAISWNLAVRLFPKHEKPIDPSVKVFADELLEKAKASDTENASNFISMSNDRRGGYG